MKKSIFVVIPNYNGAIQLSASIDSVLAQSYTNFTLILVDNGSHDESRAIMERYCAKDKRVRTVYQEENYGYTGGVNPGMQLAIDEGADYVAPFNNDAVAHKDWLKHLAEFLDTHEEYGVAACNLLHMNGKTYDSTGDIYTIWGIPYPRDRNKKVRKDDVTDDIFGASGGASLYRTTMLAKIGIFDQDFFAYYEDIDLSFRAQLNGWKVRFIPKSIVYHEQGMTADAMPSGFTTYQYMKNLPFILVKDVPGKLFWRVAPRFVLAYSIFLASAIFKNGKAGPAMKGLGKSLSLLPKKIGERREVQKTKTVSDEYVWNILAHDLPPNALKLRKLRSLWWHFVGRHE